MDRWKVLNIQSKGGLNTSTDTLSYQPGEATVLTNFEAGIYGGYRRINGYQKYSATQPNGTNKILGVCVYDGGPSQTSGVLACSGANVYFGSGTSWSSITTARTSAGRYTFAKYFNGTTRCIAMCDGVNPAAKWDGTTYTSINGTGAPTNPKVATYFNSCLVLAGYTSGGGNCCFSMSAPNADTDFNGADGAIEINVHDEIIAIRNFRQVLYIFCARSIYQLNGTNISTYAIAPVATGIGCLAYDSLQECNGDLVYLSADGIRTLSGTMKLNDTELGDLSKPIINLANSVFAYASFNPDNICSCIIRDKNQYRLFYAPISATTTDYLGIIGCIRPGKQTMTQFGTYISIWEWSTLQGIPAICADSDFTSSEEVIVFGAVDGYVYQQEIGNSFNGVNIPATYTTAPLQIEDVELRKLIEKCTLFFHLEGSAQVTVQPIYDFNDGEYAQPPSITINSSSGASVYGSGSLYGTAIYGNGTSTPSELVNLIGSFKILQLQFSSNDMNAPYSIQGATLQYRPLGRR